MASPTAGTIITKTINKGSGLKIRSPPQITAEQEKVLRDQLHIEIANKTKVCSNIAYECSLPRIDGYEYCLRHILQDAHSPFKQCTFLLTNGKRCLQPAPKYDPKKDIFTSFCFEHSRLSQRNKTRTVVGKFKKIDTNETILKDLSHHVSGISKAKTIHNNSVANNLSLQHTYDACESSEVRPYIDPFHDIDAVRKNETNRNILDYASDSSSDEDTATIQNRFRGNDIDNSDNESIDSQNEDLLKHAEVYTTAEVTRITKEKLMRLRTLYVEQLYRLKHVLREKRRKYLHTLKTEKETLSSIHDQPTTTLAEKKLYDKLKALNKYHKRNGMEAIMYKRFTEKRLKGKDTLLQGPQKTSFHNRCIFTEGGVKCGERIIPCSKYCRKHILEDKKQVLFKTCDIEKGGIVCKEPVPAIFEDSTCVLHIQLPPQLRTYTQKKYESESDDEITETSPSTPQPSAPFSLPSEPQKMETDNRPIKEELNDSIDDIKPDLTTNVTICHDVEQNLNSNVIQPAEVVERTNATETPIIDAHDTPTTQDEPMSL